MTSLIGAFVGWRAALASGAAGGARSHALVRQAASEEANIRADVYVDAARLDYLRLTDALSRAHALRQLAAEQHNASVGAALLVEARAYSRAAATVRLHIDPGALTATGGLDIARLRSIYYQEEANVVPLDPGPLLRESKRNQGLAGRLKDLALGSIIAAFFLTLAQVSRTRAWWLYLGGGLVVLLALAGDLIVAGV